MNRLTAEQFAEYIGTAPIKPRLRRELRFNAATSQLSDDDWARTELLAVSDRTGRQGVLIIQPGGQPHFIAYELTTGIAARTTGRAQPIICDFCRTWQRGSNAASITLTPNYRTGTSTTFLCCADLDCSRHVRTLTNAAKMSRAQLREDLDDAGRTLRLQQRLNEIITHLNI